MEQRNHPKKPPTAGSWKPGQSGNVRGRTPNARALAEAVRDAITPDEMVSVAIEIVRDADAETRDRLAALAWLGDRGYGRAMQPLELAAVVEAHRAPQLDATAVLGRLSTAAIRELVAAAETNTGDAPGSGDESEDVR